MTMDVNLRTIIINVNFTLNTCMLSCMTFVARYSTITAHTDKYLTCLIVSDI